METKKYGTGWESLGYNSYNDYLASDIWKERSNIKINNNPNCYLCGVEKRKIEKIKVKWYCRICNLKYRDYKKQVGIRIPLKCFRGKKHIFTNEKLKIIGEFLIVHHITYFNVGNEDSGDLVVLCRICHKKIHTKKGVANAGGV